MNTRNRIVTTLAVIAIGGAVGTALVASAPKRLKGRVLDRSTVCMVNDKVLSSPQMPVLVGEKTYYGCCAGCVERLNKDRAARIGTDPVTGREVDKSRAVILRGERGTALYFESTDTARRYQETLRSGLSHAG
ncbi:MAG: hypothetical protein HYZ74_01045 [Elusimicrobia bacterium]|nr:hypothetical protein [Elusimicrobiota bacterium]